ncbi:hypothetical protein ACU8M5_10755 [Rhizobium leguminosarum]
MLFSGATIVGRGDERANAGTILIGIDDTPRLENGRLSLNHKRAASNVSSATEYVCLQTDETVDLWRTTLGLEAPGISPFRGQTIVVEDASVDTCLAAIALAMRLNGETLPQEWGVYAGLWEKGYTEITGLPEQSFGALLSSLVHVELQDDTGTISGDSADAYFRAMTKGAAYAKGLLALGASPFNIPIILLNGPADVQLLHQQARSRLNYEKLTYQRLAEAAPRLQLAIHLAGSRRKALLDAILFSEILLTGTLKSFARSEKETFTGQGYAFMGLYRPALSGTGNDITISTKPSAGFDMSALWLELERLEDEKWSEFERRPGGFSRPRGGEKDRRLASHDLQGFKGSVSHQPWWDDSGLRTLLAAPRSVPFDDEWHPGTLLTWSDIKEAIWKCYAPTMGLRVRSRANNSAEALKLSDNTPEVAALRKPLIVGSGIYVADMVRANREADDIVLWSPTLSAIIASILATGGSRIDELPSQNTFDVIEARGGVLIVTESGVALIEMATTGEFPADQLKKAASEIAQTVAVANDLEEKIRKDIRGLVINALNEGENKNKRDALKAIYGSKLHAREAWENATRIETNDLVRRFREICERRWQAKAKFENALTEINELEDMVLTTSEVRANTILNNLAIYGLPASLAGNILGGLLLIDGQGEVHGFSKMVLGVYLALSIAGVFLVRRLWKHENRSWRINP